MVSNCPLKNQFSPLIGSIVFVIYRSLYHVTRQMAVPAPKVEVELGISCLSYAGGGVRGVYKNISVWKVCQNPGPRFSFRAFLSVLGTAVRGPLTGRRLCQPWTTEGEGPGGEGASAVGHWEIR